MYRGVESNPTNSRPDMFGGEVISSLFINPETENHLLSFNLHFVFPTYKQGRQKREPLRQAENNKKSQTFDTLLPKPVRMHIISYINQCHPIRCDLPPTKAPLCSQPLPPFTTCPCSTANIKKNYYRDPPRPVSGPCQLPPLGGPTTKRKGADGRLSE